jgi:hypothetical protein
MTEASPLLEKIIERLSGARRARCAGLTLDGCPRRIERAGVPRVLRRDPRGDRLGALEARTGIERHTLDATVEIDPAPRAAAVAGHRQRKAVPASRAPEHLVRCHQVRCLGAFRPLARFSRWLWPLAVSRLVLISALPVLPVAHLGFRVPGSGFWVRFWVPGSGFGDGFIISLGSPPG